MQQPIPVMQQPSVSVDENCTLSAAQIHNECFCMLNQVSIAKNENKFYLMQVLYQNRNVYLWKRWGRVGLVGQSSLNGPKPEQSIISEFKKIFHDKTGLEWENRRDEPLDKHYAYMKLDVTNTSTGSHTSGQITVSGISRSIPDTDPSLDPRVCKFVKEICDEKMMANAMAVTYQIDVQKLPLGKLSVEQLDSADKILKELDDAIKTTATLSVLERLSSKFWTLVPQASKLTQRLPIIDNVNWIQKLADTLDGLRNIQAAVNGLQRSNTLKDLYISLAIEMIPCDAVEMEILSLMLKGTVSSVHGSNIELVDAVRLNKPGQDIKDTNNKFYTLPNHLMLFHGSRTSNFMGILTEGLRVPRQDQVSNGSTLGLGCYFADCSTKSLQYCYVDNHGYGYMLVCEVAVGTAHIVQGCCSNLILPPFHSRLARGRKTVDFVKEDGILYPKGPIRPKRDTSFGTFEHDEIVIPDAHQYRFRYLMKIKRL